MITVKFIEQTSVKVVFTTNGADGVGVPSGGTTGQLLAKASNTNYDTEWVTGGGGGGGSVDSVTGTANRIVITGTATDPIVNISSAYDSAITAEIAAAANTRIIVSNVTQVSHTGTATETKLFSALIPAGTMETGDHIRFNINTVNGSGSGNKVWRVYMNTADAIPASTLQIATYTYTGFAGRIIRNMWVSASNTLRMLLRATGAATDETATALNNTWIDSVTIDFSVDQYFIITCALGNSGDTTYLFDVQVIHMKP